MTDQPHNILLLYCDELRADALGCFGNPLIKTPHIDRLASQGALFTQCMVTQPTCTPSRASLLTGLYPSALRTRMVGCFTQDDPRFLPRLFAAHGYRTASIGKIHLVPQHAEPEALTKSRMGEGRYDYYGFQEVDLVNGHGDLCFGPQYDAWVNSRVPDAQERLARRKHYEHGVPGPCGSYSYELPAKVHSSNYIGDQTVAFLRGAGDTPFFLHVSFPDPHHPFCVPEPYASMYKPEDMPLPVPPVTSGHQDVPPLQRETFFGQRQAWTDTADCDRIVGTPPHDYWRFSSKDWQQVKALYYGMISLVDENIGRIMSALAETGLDSNTILLFVTDHGDYLGDHGFYGKGFHYDSVIRTPLIVRGPRIKGGRRIDSIASTLDIAPTLLDMAGIDEPEGVQGCSLKGVLQGSAPSSRQAALTENDDDFAPMKVRTLTTSGWKLTYYCGQDYGELYDRQNDPQEMRNLWSDLTLAAQKQELMDMLLEELLCGLDVSNGRRQKPSKAAHKWVARHNC